MIPIFYLTPINSRYKKKDELCNTVSNYCSILGGVDFWIFWDFHKDQRAFFFIFMSYCMPAEMIFWTKKETNSLNKVQFFFFFK
jgi:hypothetical protein